MSTNDMQDTGAGDQPDNVTVSPGAASPPEPLVVVEFDGRCFHAAYATCPMRLVLVWTDEDFDEDDESVVDVDGEFASVEEVDVSDDGIDADTVKMLKAAGIDVAGVAVAKAKTEETSAEDHS